MRNYMISFLMLYNFFFFAFMFMNAFHAEIRQIFKFYKSILKEVFAMADTLKDYYAYCWNGK